MRKNQREVTDFNKMIEILDKCQTIRLGLFDANYPYIVPLSFGYEAVDGKLRIYFHCAKEGKKVDLIAANGNCCVEADNLDGYKKTEHGVTADYESVIAVGSVEQVFGDEAIKGIDLLLEHCRITGYSAEHCVKMNIVSVYKITVEKITCKKRFI